MLARTDGAEPSRGVRSATRKPSITSCPLVGKGSSREGCLAWSERASLAPRLAGFRRERLVFMEAPALPQPLVRPVIHSRLAWIGRGTFTGPEVRLAGASTQRNSN